MLTIPKTADFDFHAPDRWTGRASAFNEGQHTKWGVRFIVVANKAGWQKYNHELYLGAIRELSAHIPDKHKPYIARDYLRSGSNHEDRIQ